MLRSYSKIFFNLTIFKTHNSSLSFLNVCFPPCLFSLFGATPNMHPAYNMGEYKAAGDYKGSSAGGLGHGNHNSGNSQGLSSSHGINATNNNENHNMNSNTSSSTSLSAAAAAAAAAAAVSSSSKTAADHNGTGGGTAGSYASYFGQLAASSAMDNVMCRPVH